jgi:hypothetical protein
MRVALLPDESAPRWEQPRLEYLSPLQLAISIWTFDLGQDKFRDL